MDPVGRIQSEGAVGHPRQRLHRIGVVAVGQHAVRGQPGKLPEGFLNVRQIVEIIQMIRLDVQHHRQCGEEIQE